MKDRPLELVSEVKGSETISKVKQRNNSIKNSELNKYDTVLSPIDFANVVAHFKQHSVPVLWRDGSNVRIELLKKSARKKLLTHHAATRKLADELQALDLQVSESRRAA